MIWAPLKEAVLDHCLSQHPTVSALEVINGLCQEAMRYAGVSRLTYDPTQRWFEFHCRLDSEDDDYHALFKIEHEVSTNIFAREPPDEVWERFKKVRNYLRHKLDYLLRRSIVEQRILVRARIGSPLGTFETVAPDSFMHFRIVDWTAGNAESDSVSIYSISLCVRSEDLESDTSIARTGAVGRPSPRYLVLKEFERRCTLGLRENSLAGEAKALASFVLSLTPPVPSMGQRAIENFLRPEWRKIKPIK